MYDRLTDSELFAFYTAGILAACIHQHIFNIFDYSKSHTAVSLLLIIRAPFRSISISNGWNWRVASNHRIQAISYSTHAHISWFSFIRDFSRSTNSLEIQSKAIRNVFLLDGDGPEQIHPNMRSCYKKLVQMVYLDTLTTL